MVRCVRDSYERHEQPAATSKHSIRTLCTDEKEIRILLKLNAIKKKKHNNIYTFTD